MQMLSHSKIAVTMEIHTHLMSSIVPQPLAAGAKGQVFTDWSSTRHCRLINGRR
jgi:hypothetical protein